MYPVSPGWRWRPISRTRRGVAHLCTFPPSGEVLLPNCPPPGGGLDIRWWKSCLFECALPGGTDVGHFTREEGIPTSAIYRGGYPYRKVMRRPFTGVEGIPTGGCMRRPFYRSGGYACVGHLPGEGIPKGGFIRRPCHQSTGQDQTKLLSACLHPEHRTGTPVAPPSAGPHVGGLATSPEGEHYCGGG
jgi:hypothetical protein